MKTFKITNVTHVSTGGRGFFLDLGSEGGGRHIGVGKTISVTAASVDAIPAGIQKWAAKKWVRIQEVGSEEVLAGLAVNQELTPSAINPVSEAKAEDDFNAEPDISMANEAVLAGEEAGPISQSHAQTAKITDSAAEERHSSDISPLPGDKPRDLGDAELFTVKAPKTDHVGGVVKA